MTIRSLVTKVTDHDGLNFALTNWIPRRVLTRFIRWFSTIEQPLVRDLSMVTWRFFSDLDLADAQESRFKSVHACFTRKLKEGARPLDPDPSTIVSPCDGIVGTFGTIRGQELLQIKGSPYSLLDLLRDPDLASRFENGRYATLRLTAGAYHRFHAPADCRVEGVTYFSGDRWNVNPPALRRIGNLFCKNERAVVRTKLLPHGSDLALVPVGAILVGSIRLTFLEPELPRDAGRQLTTDASFRKGEEMGWFEHGSTIVVLATPAFVVCSGIQEGMTIRMGMPLMRLS